MGRRIRRDRRLHIEQVERRELLSAITDIMVANSLTTGRQAQTNLSFSSQSIAIPQNQGPLLNPDGTINNAALAPTGTLTSREKHREQFAARYVGTFTVGPGRTSDEANQVFITGAGSANTMLHSDIQMLLVTPTVSTGPIGGVTSIFDRNINSNTALGFDIAAPQGDVDAGGRPNYFPTVSIDTNISSGIYVESYAVGTINIKYIPNGKHTPGVYSQGKAIVTIHAQIYAAGTSFILRNSGIDA